MVCRGVGWWGRSFGAHSNNHKKKNNKTHAHPFPPFLVFGVLPRGADPLAEDAEIEVVGALHRQLLQGLPQVVEFAQLAEFAQAVVGNIFHFLCFTVSSPVSPFSLFLFMLVLFRFSLSSFFPCASFCFSSFCPLLSFFHSCPHFLLFLRLVAFFLPLCLLLTSWML